MKKLLVLAAVLACISTQSFAQEAQKAASVLSTPGGRYVFGQISEYRRDQYMLDTQTGRLWQIVNNKTKNPDGTPDGGEYTMLDWIPYAQNDNKVTLPPPVK